MKKSQFIQSSGCRIRSVQYVKDEAVLPPEEEQVCFSARWKVINNSQLRGKAVLGSWSLPLRVPISAGC